LLTKIKPMKQISFAIILIFCGINQLMAQNIPGNSRIDLMLIQGDYKKVIDTCKQILTYDSLNPEIHYKMGIAYQNTLEEDLSLNSYYLAANLNPENKVYNFTLAKGYFGKGKFRLAETLLSKLCSIDSMNWVYAYYLTSIYLQSNKFDEAISIYKRFLMKDSTNYVYLDKIAFASLKKGDFEYATDLYNKSLSINNKNLTAIKNLAYLYAVTMNSDTAIQLLTNGIKIDSSDIDLYVRRAQLYYSKNYTKRALDDYLVILSTGDSSKLYLKRVGIGYCYNLQPEEAIFYLLKAYKVDSTDYETCNYLGQCYYKIKDMKNSIYYYNNVIKILTPVNIQLGLTYVLYAESQKGDGMYKDAIASYQKAQSIKSDPNIYMIIANIYDEKFKNKEKAIYYYQKFLDTYKKSKMNFTQEYVGRIRKRLEFLKRNST
jgi:tetratricopeptide (TPR) repeat protein